MEKKYKIITDKRIDHKIKDRGDSLQKVNETKNIPTKKGFMPDRGDSGAKMAKFDNVNDKNTIADVVRNKIINKTESIVVSKKSVVENERNLNRLLVIEEKRRIRDKYTFRSKAKVPNNILYASKFNNVRDSVTEVNNDSSKKHNRDSEEKFYNLQDYTKSESTKTDKQSATKEKSHKRPVIRTITSKNDATKVYKAVTFGEQERKLTPLRIKIPNDASTKTTRIPKLIQNYERVCGTTVKEKPCRNRSKRHKNNSKSSFNSSSVTVSKYSGSPPTEVAKWAPNCINKHTRPYYEAWVNTTPTAMSKMSKNDRLLLETKHLDAFKRTLARSQSPELMYEHFLDERYTGKIKINHR